MKSFFYGYLFILTFLLSSLQAEILEINNLAEALPYVDEDTLVVLDIDDTLMVPAQMLGGDCWFRFSLKELQELGLSFEEALAKILPEYMLLQHITEVLPAEMETASVVHQFQKKGHKVIGLTTRSTELAYRTIEELKSLDIDLSKVPLFHEETYLSTAFPLCYIEGILFTQLRHKGQALRELCDFLGFGLKKVIFINDKLKYLEQLEDTFSGTDVDYIGFRYGACDHDIEEYDPALANIQKKYYNALLSDEDASAILAAKQKEESIK
ncbi:MAG: hypothetical protein S4CHLAM7_08100 [Chlamydiae bacterium]|nr:hypothetical protein [Chlamydiota bacterium]